MNEDPLQHLSPVVEEKYFGIKGEDGTGIDVVGMTQELLDKEVILRKDVLRDGDQLRLTTQDPDSDRDVTQVLPLAVQQGVLIHGATTKRVTSEVNGQQVELVGSALVASRVPMTSGLIEGICVGTQPEFWKVESGTPRPELVLVGVTQDFSLQRKDADGEYRDVSPNNFGKLTSYESPNADRFREAQQGLNDRIGEVVEGIPVGEDEDIRGRVSFGNRRAEFQKNPTTTRLSTYDSETGQYAHVQHYEDTGLIEATFVKVPEDRRGPFEDEAEDYLDLQTLSRNGVSFVTHHVSTQRADYDNAVTANVRLDNADRVITTRFGDGTRSHEYDEREDADLGVREGIPVLAVAGQSLTLVSAEATLDGAAQANHDFTEALGKARRGGVKIEAEIFHGAVDKRGIAIGALTMLTELPKLPD